MSEAPNERLEMMLVLRWLDEGAPEDGAIFLAVDEVAQELGFEADRQGLLSVMSALGALEERGLLSVRWSRGTSPEALVHLSSSLRRDARRLFGRSEPSIDG